MSLLNLVYTQKSGHYYYLYTANYNGTTWSGDTKINDQPGGISVYSEYAPAAAVLNNRLYVIYCDAANDVCCAYFDGSLWHGGVKISSMPGGISPKSHLVPGVAVYNNMLYLAYLDPNSHAIYTAWFDGTTWYGNSKIADQSGGITPESCTNPAAVAYKGKLYIIYLGKHLKHLLTATFNGITWDGNTPISSQPGDINPKTSFTPGACVYNNRLYIAYGGAATNKFYTAYFTGSRWEGNTEIADQPGDISPASSDNPGMAAFNGNLYLAYKGSWFRALYTCVNRMNEWYGNDKISDQTGGIAPYSPYRPAVCVSDLVPDALTTWMGALDSSTLVSEINIPGTHDSAAINTGIHTPYACHNSSITDQLRGGIRLLDVRIQIHKNSDNTYQFTTCHGDLGSNVGINTFQSYDSLMIECKNFLSKHSNEGLIMSLKVDDWSNVTSASDKTAALTVLKALIAGYKIANNAIVIHPTGIPTLGDIRGKIVLYNRINSDLGLGIPISWSDNTSGSMAASSSNRSYNVWVQDQYEGLPLVGSEPAKAVLVESAFAHKTSGMVVWNYASAVWYGLFGVYIMSDLLNYFGAHTATNRPATFGWILFDYPFNKYQTNTYGPLDIVQLIVGSNNSYHGYTEKFQVMHRDEL